MHTERTSSSPARGNQARAHPLQKTLATTQKQNATDTNVTPTPNRHARRRSAGLTGSSGFDTTERPALIEELGDQSGDAAYSLDRAQPPVATDAIIREPECRRRTGLSRSTRWRLERRGQFPRRRQLSPGCSGWIASEIAAWIAGR
jgi:prophage regulatory protein